MLHTVKTIPLDREIEENDLVYDCFMGSGTTAKAAIAANRKYIGSEISKECYVIIQKRLQPMLNNLFT